jgi:hypothetical protein
MAMQISAQSKLSPLKKAFMQGPPKEYGQQRRKRVFWRYYTDVIIHHTA